mgnify:FL=1
MFFGRKNIYACQYVIITKSILFINPSVYKCLRDFSKTFLSLFLRQIILIDYKQSYDIIMLRYEINVSRETLFSNIK